MTITLSVANLPARQPADRPYYPRKVALAGWLWLDRAEARLFDWDSDLSIPFCDEMAFLRLRAEIAPPREFISAAVLEAKVREGKDGPELYDVEYVTLFEKGETDQVDKWGITISIRSSPGRGYR